MIAYIIEKTYMSEYIMRENSLTTILTAGFIFCLSGTVSVASAADQADLGRNPVGVILYEHANYEGTEILINSDIENLKEALQ